MDTIFSPVEAQKIYETAVAQALLERRESQERCIFCQMPVQFVGDLYCSVSCAAQASNDEN